MYELEKHFNSDDIVLIHDAIRPMVSADIISDCIRVTRERKELLSLIGNCSVLFDLDDEDDEEDDIFGEHESLE